MFRKILKTLPLAAVALGVCSGVAMAGKSNDTLVWATDRETAVVDPYYNRTRELVIMGHAGWDGLLYRNIETGEYEPLLAKSYKWVDNLTLDFELRDDVVFHDGSTFGPEDVVYTVNFTTKKENGIYTYNKVSWMKSAEQTGPHSVRIHLEKPFPAALAYLAQAVYILPDGHYDKAPTTKEGKKDYTSVPPVGTGPYKVVDVVPGEKVVMEAFDKYMKNGPKGQPAIKHLVYRTIKETNTQIAELLTGGIDWMWKVEVDQAEGLRSMPDLTVVDAETMRIGYLGFDAAGTSGDHPLTDVKVRQALSHAINRQAIVDNLFPGGARVVNSACFPEQFGCEQDVTVYDYDPEKAKALLAEAGYPDGFEMTLDVYRNREMAEAMIGDLAKIGVDATMNYGKYAAIRDAVRSGGSQAGYLTWGSNSIGDISASTSVFFKGGADDIYQDAEVTEWLTIGDTSTDPAVRKDVYSKALKKIAAEAYWLPLWSYPYTYAFTSDLDFTPTSDEIPHFALARWK